MNFKLLLLFISTLFLFMSSSYEDRHACGPVDYYHVKVLNKNTRLDSWLKDKNGPFDSIVKLSASWWKNAPQVNGWPAWCTAAQLDRHYRQSGGAVPGSACSFVILACLKYYTYSGDSAYLNMAKKTGDYILHQDLTPSSFKCYPGFPYAVGKTGDINPDGSGHPNASSVMNPPGHIQPDKGAMLGVALLELYKVTVESSYLKAAINIADCLSRNAVTGTALNSPWPFRVMADNGAFIDGKLCANVSYACRLFDELLRIGQAGNGKYRQTKVQVWNWLKTFVISRDDGSMWEDFFEDHGGNEPNSTQINALETVRYLLENRNDADPQWFNLAGKIIKQVQSRWALSKLEKEGYVCIGEQDRDMSPYNSHTARYGSILAMYYTAGGPVEYKDEAYHSLCYSLYSVENDGFTCTYFKPGATAWTSDSFGDFLIHYMYAFSAIPEWSGKSNYIPE